jgi:hypothetical protein
MWRDLYSRDFQNKDEQLSDLANYHLLYKIKSMENLNDKKKYIPFSELYPEKIVFGPVIKNYNGAKHIITSFVDTFGQIIQPIILKVSGFAVELLNHNAWNMDIMKVNECHNNDFKSLINNLASFISHNFNKIVLDSSNSFFYNGNQYKSLADVTQKNPNPTMVLNQLQKNVLQLQVKNNFIINLKPNKHSIRLVENCLRCNKWHHHGRSIDQHKICALFETPPKKTKSPKRITENVVFTNSTLVLKMQGYIYSPTLNTLSINWECEEVWLNN